jgi:acyl-coenzyme A thioesterase PaaI-like protein
MANNTPLQDRLHEENPIRGCFGCGADNPLGLKLKSYVEGDELVARFIPNENHCSYRGFLNGGIATTLIDCHSAWTAFASDQREEGFEYSDSPEKLPAGWTKALTIEFLKPTPMDRDITLRAHVIKKGTKSRTVACSLYAGHQECVKGEVVIVMAPPTG